jgi:hypothetical protein
LNKYSDSPFQYSDFSICSYRNESFIGEGGYSYECDYWLSAEELMKYLPEIKYQNKPESCKHAWYENSKDRFCSLCGTVQKLQTINKTWK